MATVALFPSVLGLRPSFYDWADTLRKNGHDVRIVDLFDGGARDGYEEGMALLDEIGQPELMKRAVERTADVPGGCVVMGFSIGAAAAQYLATVKPVIGAVLVAGAMPMKGWEKPWPAGVPAQVHVKEQDEFATPEEVSEAATGIKETGGSVEVFTYPGAGHLFNDKGLPEEYDGEATNLMLARVLEFLERVD